MQVIITLAGLGQRFKSEGYNTPKPLISVMGKPAISYLIACLDPAWNLFFAIGEHFKNSDLESSIKKQCPGAQIFYVPYSSRGPIDTVEAVIPYLNSDQAVAVSYCDYFMLWNLSDFKNFLKNTNCDICIPSYKGFHPTYLGPNTYAHLQVNEQSNEIEKIQEKKLFGTDIYTEWTSAGFYYFKSVALLKKGMNLQSESNLKYGNEFYTSLAIEALLNNCRDLKIMNYEISHFLQLGTPADVSGAEKWYKYIILDQKKNDFKPNTDDYQLYQYWETIFKNLF